MQEAHGETVQASAEKARDGRERPRSARQWIQPNKPLSLSNHEDSRGLYRSLLFNINLAAELAEVLAFLEEI